MTFKKIQTNKDIGYDFGFQQYHDLKKHSVLYKLSYSVKVSYFSMNETFGSVSHAQHIPKRDG